jgi:hypothetical protein
LVESIEKKYEIGHFKIISTKKVGFAAQIEH